MTKTSTRIASIPLFAKLRRSERSLVDRLGVWLDVAGGRVLCREGERGDQFFVLVDGRAGAQSSTGIVSILHGGDWFGEVSLLTGAARCATVTTFTPATLIVFGRREFADLLRIAPSVRTRLESRAARLVASCAPPVPGGDRPLVTRPTGAGSRS
jgi:CRP-like cAMP-binding protein